MDLLDGSGFWQFSEGPAAPAGPAGLLGKMRSPTMTSHPTHITGWLLALLGISQWHT